jgi:cytochrome c551/c552
MRVLRLLGVVVNALFLAAPLALMACSSPRATATGGNPDGGGTTQYLPCDVDSVLARNCRSCHSNPPQFAAPMPLVTYADLRAIAPADPDTTGTNVPVYQAVEQRINDNAAPMPQPPNPRLNAADTATLDNWVDAGAPPGTAACAPVDAGTDSSVALECTPDEILSPPTPWAMPQDTDDVYVCYGVQLNLTSTRQVIGMEPRVDNHSIVHHMLLYQADTPQSPTPTACSLGGATDWRIVYGWAPGGQPFNMPPTVGFDEDSTTNYVVQVHYNNINHLAGQTDTSGFDLCSTTQLRPNVADVMAFGTTNFTIPANAKLDITCSLQVTLPLGPLHMFSAFPHMHQLGTLIETTQLPGGQPPPVGMGAQLNWNFQNQLWFPIDTIVNEGDTINTRCAWNNTTSSPVSFGPYTEDEMCFSFTMYYPKITSPQWEWGIPAYLSTCSPTGADGGVSSDAAVDAAGD